MRYHTTAHPPSFPPAPSETALAESEFAEVVSAFAANPEAGFASAWAATIGTQFPDGRVSACLLRAAMRRVVRMAVEA